MAIAADDAQFTSAYRHIGKTPDGGATWALPQIVVMRKAMEICSSDNDSTRRRHCESAWSIGSSPQPSSTRPPKRSHARWRKHPLSRFATRSGSAAARSLSEQLPAEAESFDECAATPGFREGVQAFVAKRKLRFGG